MADFIREDGTKMSSFKVRTGPSGTDIEVVVPTGPLSEAGAVFFRDFPAKRPKAEAWARPGTPKLGRVVN